MRKSPGFLIALLTVHSTPLPINESLREELIAEGMIEPWRDTFTTTAKGRAFAELLCQVPYPVQKWVDPRLKP